MFIRGYNRFPAQPEISFTAIFADIPSLRSLEFVYGFVSPAMEAKLSIGAWVAVEVLSFSFHSAASMKAGGVLQSNRKLPYFVLLFSPPFPFIDESKQKGRSCQKSSIDRSAIFRLLIKSTAFRPLLTEDLPLSMEKIILMLEVCAE